MHCAAHTCTDMRAVRVGMRTPQIDKCTATECLTHSMHPLEWETKRFARNRCDFSQIACVQGQNER